MAEPEQIATQIGLQAVIELLEKQSSMLSEFIDSQKGEYGTTVRGTHVTQDVNTDEVIAHSHAALTNLNQFWNNQLMFQTVIANAETLRAFSNNNAVTNQQNWNGTGGSKALA